MGERFCWLLKKEGGVFFFHPPPMPVQEQGFNREMEGVLGFGALFWGDRELPSVASGCRVCMCGVCLMCLTKSLDCSLQVVRSRGYGISLGAPPRKKELVKFES